jgi:hypothetical protein
MKGVMNKYHAHCILKHTSLVATGCDMRDRTMNPIKHIRGKYKDNTKFEYIYI